MRAVNLLPLFFYQNMAQVRIVNPGAVLGTYIVPLNLMKEHLRVSGTAEDTLITAYIDSAAEYVSSVANRSFKYQYDLNVYVYLDRGEHYAKIRRVSDLTMYQVRYKNDQGGYTLMDPADYIFDGECYPAVIEIKNEPSDITEDTNDAVYRVWLKGGESASALPKQFRLAMMLLVSHYYTNREAEYVGGITTELKEGVKRLLNTVRKF